jgi:hypothetical protein
MEMVIIIQLIGQLIMWGVIAGVAYAVYQDAIGRGWGSGSAILMAIVVFFLILIPLPIYLLIKDNPGRSKVSLAANREIARQFGQGAKDIVIDSSEIAREVGISKVKIVRKLLYQSVLKGELPTGVRIL